MKFLSDLLVQGDGNEIFLKSADHNISRIIPRGTGANLDKGLFSLFDTGTEDVRIDTAGASWFNGGNVGIGTASPDVKFQVQGGAVKAATSDYASPSTGGAISMFQDSNDYGTIWSVKDYNGGWGNVAISPSGGNVGIGTTSPGARLNVVGHSKFNGTNYHSHFNYVGDSSEDTYIRGGKPGAKVYINDSHNSNVLIAGGGGNVGIGTTSPGAKLHVDSSTV